MPYAVIDNRLHYRPTRCRANIGMRGQRDRKLITLHDAIGWTRTDGNITIRGYDTITLHATKGLRKRSTINGVVRHAKESK